jgi:hypothetical protein
MSGAANAFAIKAADVLRALSSALSGCLKVLSISTNEVMPIGDWSDAKMQYQPTKRRLSVSLIV